MLKSIAVIIGGLTGFALLGPIAGVIGAFAASKLADVLGVDME